jgi:uncharacterized protein
MLRRTPCIGICSTTYGDLVCRGCKRFAHEIVQWNAFDADQRRAVWSRLLTLRAGAVASVLEVVDESCLRVAARRLGIDQPELDADNLLYETLQRLQWREGGPGLEDLGARVRGAMAGNGHEAGALLGRIDQEFWQRSVADYERSYRIPAQ